jgi:hypothetical protein
MLIAQMKPSNSRATAAMIGSNFGPNQQKVKAGSYTDEEILNFALNLEYLEAEFYAMSTYGATLVDLGVITEGVLHPISLAPLMRHRLDADFPFTRFSYSLPPRTFWGLNRLVFLLKLTIVVA